MWFSLTGALQDSSEEQEEEREESVATGGKRGYKRKHREHNEGEQHMGMDAGEERERPAPARKGPVNVVAYRRDMRKVGLSLAPPAPVSNYRTGKARSSRSSQSTETLHRVRGKSNPHAVTSPAS